MKISILIVYWTQLWRKPTPYNKSLLKTRIIYQNTSLVESAFPLLTDGREVTMFDDSDNSAQ